MNYRERCYQNFVSSHWKYSHTFSQETYNLFAKASRKKFKSILPDDKEGRIIDIACGAGHGPKDVEAL